MRFGWWCANVGSSLQTSHSGGGCWSWGSLWMCGGRGAMENFCISPSVLLWTQICSKKNKVLTKNKQIIYSQLGVKGSEISQIANWPLSPSLFFQANRLRKLPRGPHGLFLMEKEGVSKDKDKPRKVCQQEWKTMYWGILPGANWVLSSEEGDLATRAWWDSRILMNQCLLCLPLIPF